MEILSDKLGRPIKDLRISVMDTCNYRCPYCMPADKFDDNYQFLKPQQRLSFDEITRIVEIFANFGVNKIRLTGGEPLLRKNLPQLIRQLKNIQGIKDVALTSNGQLLKPQLPALIDAGLDRVNISLDTIDPDLYHQMSGYKGKLDVVMAAIEAARVSPLKSVKLNCVVQKGVNDDQIIPLLAKFQNTDVVVRFIEYMDVGNKNDWHETHVFNFMDIIQIIEKEWNIKAVDPNYKGEVASRYKYRDYPGEIGFITSISKPFCSDCSRARLSADGKLYTCLFASEAFDLKKHLRTENDGLIEDFIKDIWQHREDRYSETRHQLTDKKDKIEMYVIGG
jgi:cyclic pyranopterin phosphate synthase